ncbi:hypothetical protein BZL29_3633 [Mycobacterium kansasii]|uniref:Uncharacterized protein n=1 Tax=Mycobacterium kansasii TaxID=1768 RepID=A0A1V3XFB2_MYCKA|nr:hypothetical protein BZL29_3633 [Mycobacterium kansasii]
MFVAGNQFANIVHWPERPREAETRQPGPVSAVESGGAQDDMCLVARERG